MVKNQISLFLEKNPDIFNRLKVGILIYLFIIPSYINFTYSVCLMVSILSKCFLEIWLTKPSNFLVKRVFLFYIGFFMMCLIKIDKDMSRLYTDLFFMCNISDGCQYLCGRTVGKYTPRLQVISKSKTYGGYFAGLLMYCLFVQYIYNNSLLFSVSVYIFGVIGDLSASFYKRLCSIKDYDDCLGTHGGFMDRFDSVLMAGLFVSIYMFFQN